MTIASHIEQALVADRAQIERHLQDLLAKGESPVARAMRYAVLGCGQRLRPMLALRASRLVGGAPDATMRAAAAVELLHCASLIVDDLPCMDNDSMRRNRPTVHVQFGEATAVLAAFALVALAARHVADLGHFQVTLLKSLDCDSLIGGQSLDLELAGKVSDLQREYVTSLKTVPLFMLSAEAAIVSASVPALERMTLQAFGREFGVAYQMVDDYLDGEVDSPAPVIKQFERTRSYLLLFGGQARHLDDLLEYLNAKIQIGCTA